MTNTVAAANVLEEKREAELATPWNMEEPLSLVRWDVLQVEKQA